MARRRKPSATGNERLSTPQSVNAAVKSVCDIMRRSNCAGVRQAMWYPRSAPAILI